MYRRQELRPSPRKKNATKQNGCLGEALQIAVKRTEAKNKGDDSTHGHHQMVNTKADQLYFLQPKMEKLYTVSKNKTGS